MNYLLKFLNPKINIFGLVAYKQYTKNRYFHPPFWQIASKKESHSYKANFGQNIICRQLMYNKYYCLVTAGYSSVKAEFVVVI